MPSLRCCMRRFHCRHPRPDYHYMSLVCDGQCQLAMFVRVAHTGVVVTGQGAGFDDIAPAAIARDAVADAVGVA